MANSFAHPEFIVETHWLADRLNDPTVRVLDCTTHLTPPTKGGAYDVVSGRVDFEKWHIPGAGFADIDNELSDKNHRLHFMLPRPELFAAAIGKLGVGDNTKVILYSTANHWWATRCGGCYAWLGMKMQRCSTVGFKNGLRSIRSHQGQYQRRGGEWGQWPQRI